MSFVLNQQKSCKCFSRPTEGVLLEVMEHRVYNVLIQEEDEAATMVSSKNVTFDESEFPGASNNSSHIDGERMDDVYTKVEVSESSDISLYGDEQVSESSDIISNGDD